MATSTNKTTIASTLRFVIDNCADKLNEEQLAKLQKMLEQTEKKSANRKSKEASETDLALMATVKACLSHDGKTVTDVRNSNSTLIPLSTPKITSLLGKLVAAGEVERYTDKRKTLFRLV